jgi:hypothetical protein
MARIGAGDVIRRARKAALVLVLLACSSSLRSSPPPGKFPDGSLHPSAGTFVGSETVTLSVQARADIHYTLDGSLPTVMSPIYRGPSPSKIDAPPGSRHRAWRVKARVGVHATARPVATEIYCA